jgi:hypothetical protein
VQAARACRLVAVGCAGVLPVKVGLFGCGGSRGGSLIVNSWWIGGAFGGNGGNAMKGGLI